MLCRVKTDDGKFADLDFVPSPGQTIHIEGRAYVIGDGAPAIERVELLNGQGWAQVVSATARTATKGGKESGKPGGGRALPRVVE